MSRLRTSILLLLLGLAGCVGPFGPPRASIPGSMGSEAVPLPARLHHGLILVEASVGETGPLQLLLDTGASFLVLTPETAARLRVAGTARNVRDHRVDTASGRRVKLDFVEVNDLRAGAFTSARATAAIADLTTFSELAGVHLDGILGMDVFRKATLVLDFPRGQVRVTRPGAAGTNAVTLRCQFLGYRPVVKLEAAGRQFDAMLDTGFPGDWEFDRRGKALPWVSPPVTVGAAAALADVTEIQGGRLATNIHWGGVCFERPTAQIKQGRDGSLIGTKVLRHFVLEIDQPRRQVRLTPATHGPVRAPSKLSFGIALVPDQDGLRVVSVIPGTDAAREGFRIGDRVTAINGEPARAWPPKRLESLRDAGGTAEMEAILDGTPRRVRLKLHTVVE